MYQYGLERTKGGGGRSRALANEGQKPLLGPTLAGHPLGHLSHDSFWTEQNL